MTTSEYLEYLFIKEFTNDNLCSSWYTKNSTSNEGWYSDGTHIKLDINKIKDRLTYLEKILLSPYVIDSTSKED